MHIVILPIEPLEERYSAQWLKWTKEALASQCDHEYTILLPDKSSYGAIKSGQFLDAVLTNKFKADQLSMAIDWISKNDDLLIGGEVVFWVHDGWFPGIEMLAYIRDAMDYDFKICACLHAGTWDPNDFISQKGMASWAANLEKSWFSVYDKVFVATSYHRDLILKSRRTIKPTFVYTTGFPIACEPGQDATQLLHIKEKIVVFPHRLAPEKSPELFQMLAFRAERIPELKDFRFLFTKYECSSKDEYYSLLNRSKYSVSFASQETWGIAMQESLIAGCIPIVPNRLSYTEMYHRKFLYDGQHADVVQAVLEKLLYLEKLENVDEYLTDNRLSILQVGKDAIPAMLEVMGGFYSPHTSRYDNSTNNGIT